MEEFFFFSMNWSVSVKGWKYCLILTDGIESSRAAKWLTRPKSQWRGETTLFWWFLTWAFFWDANFFSKILDSYKGQHNAFYPSVNVFMRFVWSSQIYFFFFWSTLQKLNLQACLHNITESEDIQVFMPSVQNRIIWECFFLNLVSKYMKELLQNGEVLWL